MKQWKSIRRQYPRHKTANGHAHSGQRIKHKGVVYRISGRAVYRESDGRYIGYRWGLFGDPRKAIDKMLRAEKRDPISKIPKRRQHNRIIGQHELEHQMDLDRFV